MRTESSTFQNLIFAAILFLVAAFPAMSQVLPANAANPTVVPQWSRYSGVVANRPAGTVEMAFRIYSATEGGEALWTETQQVAVAKDGTYSVLLGAVAEGGLPQSVFADGQARWLGVTVGPAPEQARVPLASATYAMKAADAETLGGLPAADFVTQTQFRANPLPLQPPTTGPVPAPGKGSSAIHPNAAPTGAGTANAIALWTNSSTLGHSALTQSGKDIHAAGGVNASGPIFGENDSIGGTGVMGVAGAATGTDYGVHGQTNSTGNGSAGVLGQEFTATANVSGVQGQTSSSSGTGVTGQSSATKGVTFGVNGSAFSTTGGAAGVRGWEGATTGQVWGVAGSTDSTSQGAAGVYGGAGTKGQVFGVWGNTNSVTDGAAGVWGNEYAATGVVSGVTGLATSTTNNAAGVSGNERAETGAVYGVTGSAVSTASFAAGVQGWEGAHTGFVLGVYGQTASTGTSAAGVYGGEWSSTGKVYGVEAWAGSSTDGSAGMSSVQGAKTGQVYGVYGETDSVTAGAAGVYAFEGAATGNTLGLTASVASTGGTGVQGVATAKTGATVGVVGESASSAGIGVLGKADTAGGVAGEFVNAAGSGLILEGLSKTTKVFSVDASGNGFFSGNLTLTGGLATGGSMTGVESGTNSSTTNGAAGVTGTESGKTGQVYGVTGKASSTGTGAAGVSGSESATTGVTFGVSGSASSATSGAAGVSGTESATTGQVYGVTGKASSTGSGAAGVSGTESATTGQVYGVSGSAASTGGYGVQGVATAKTGSAVGVYGESASSTGVGVLGKTTAAGAVAGRFDNLAGSGFVLYGTSKGAKVFSVDASGNGTLSGSLTVTGKLTKGSGSFKIDHPLDPANKYLSHSFVESPDMMNVYNGNIVTDQHGVATVVLPDYFDALNRDCRYQLTVIGQFAQAIVQRKVANNRFVIRTSKPGVEVSWQVTGIRQDAYANANRIPVEEQKPATEKGYYLHPEVFGQPASKSVSAAAKVVSTSTSAGVNSR